jgi:hypothetical protein
MKKSFLIMATLAMALVSCSEPAQPLAIDNALTEAEIAAARLTPEVMWKMRRIGSAEVSADGKVVLYTVTDYSMAENRGITRIYTLDLEAGVTTELTDTSSNNTAARWGGDGAIWFLSNRSGAMQVWRMAADGTELKQITNIEGGVEDFGVNNDCTALHYVKAVKAPLSHIKLLAVGGINENNMSDYLKAGISGFGIGSNIVDKKLVEANDFSGISLLAEKYTRAIAK